MSSYGYFANVYDTLMRNVDYDKLADYYTELLNRQGVTGGIVLDAGCGTGNLSIRLSQRDFDVIGTDISPAMLSIAQQKAFDSGEQILFLCQDMTRLDLYGTVDGVVCSLDVINHLSDKDHVMEAFKRISLFMNPGAVLAFDVNTVYKHDNILADNTFVYDCDDVFCVWQNSLEIQTHTVDISLDFFEHNEDGTYSRYSEQFKERAYGIDELENMLNKSGLDVIGVFDEFSFAPISENTQRAFITARKL